ncbi:MAG TPA: ABC transporter C-terminal domain-containing protein, partial [Candidatus Angelobacter sp.]|nr:ABC transporter C-terminal domain-containing protein [Candidatus Angelobacter sp.]
METRLQALEDKISRLGERLDRLEQRQAAPTVTSPQTVPAGTDPQLVAPAGAEMARWVTLLGRSCMVLGGAFLIRALTDNRTLPSGAGVTLGMAFAGVCVFFSHRAAHKSATLSAG